ncbi:MAG: flagellar export chaperone FlgN [bacterium]
MVVTESDQELQKLKSLLKDQLGAISRMFDLGRWQREAIEAEDGDRLLDLTKEEAGLELKIKSLDDEIVRWRERQGEFSEDKELTTILSQIERVWTKLMKRREENEILLAEKMKKVRSKLAEVRKTKLVQKSYKIPYTGWTVRRDDAFFVDKLQ